MAIVLARTDGIPQGADESYHSSSVSPLRVAQRRLFRERRLVLAGGSKVQGTHRVFLFVTAQALN